MPPVAEYLPTYATVVEDAVSLLVLAPVDAMTLCGVFAALMVTIHVVFPRLLETPRHLQEVMAEYPKHFDNYHKIKTEHGAGVAQALGKALPPVYYHEWVYERNKRVRAPPLCDCMLASVCLMTSMSTV